MGNLCGSPSKDRDYEDHTNVERKRMREEKMQKVSTNDYPLTLLFRERTCHKLKWRSLIVKMKESSALKTWKIKSKPNKKFKS